MEVREPSAKYLARSGYKQTEVGMIPRDWNHRTFGLLYAEPSRNGIYKASEFQGHGTRIVNMGEMFGYEFISDQDMSRVALTTRELSVSGLQDGDLLFGRRSVVPAGAGKCSLVVSPPEPITFESSIIRVRLDTTEAHPRFYYYFFASPTGRSTIGTIVSGTNVKGIRATELRELKVPLPAKAEQEAIAEALSDADALIESLEQLLTKKRQLKQGAMQELLTGKKRLSGFSGAWEVRRLGEIADIRSGGTPSTTQPQFWDGDVLWCTPTDITALNGYKYLNGTSRTISQQGLKASSAELIPANSITMTSRATIGECAINQVPVTTNQGFKNFVPSEAIHVEFLYYLLLTQKRGFISLCGGSTFLEIGKGQLAAYEVRLPATKSEQTAIAVILSDMDAEIAALEAKLAKARELKQGMMQELLTGRIRLVDPAPGARGATC